MSLLNPAVLPRLVGVIDLRHGLPVHAVAGQREHYRPVHLERPVTAAALLDHYRRLGLRRFYLADLDGIIEGTPQWTPLERLVARLHECDELLIDAGWRGQEGSGVQRRFRDLAASHDRLKWVVAGESAADPNAAFRLGELVGPSRVWLGMDYRDGVWLAAEGAEETWVRQAVADQLGGAVVLDVASVGTGGGPSTSAIVRRVRELAPHWRLLSGGGVRDGADVERLLQAGCDGCLVATALHRLGGG